MGEITLVLVFRQSFENRSNECKEKTNLDHYIKNHFLVKLLVATYKCNCFIKAINQIFHGFTSVVDLLGMFHRRRARGDLLSSFFSSSPKHPKWVCYAGKRIKMFSA